MFTLTDVLTGVAKLCSKHFFIGYKRKLDLEYEGERVVVTAGEILIASGNSQQV